MGNESSVARPPQSYIVPGDEREGWGPVHRAAEAQASGQLVTSLYPEVTTLYENFAVRPVAFCSLFFLFFPPRAPPRGRELCEWQCDVHIVGRRMRGAVQSLP